MKQTSLQKAQRRVGVAEAKARLSVLLRESDRGPTVIHSRGRDVAVLVGVSDYERLAALDGDRSSGASFLRDVEQLKRTLGGADEFAPARARIRARAAPLEPGRR